jgi:hypothetical protein
MRMSLDIANLERLYAGGETTPEAIVTDVYARIRARGAAPDWITLVGEDERHPLAIRNPGEHVQPRLHLRRIELGLGGRRRFRPRILRARH